MSNLPVHFQEIIQSSNLSPGEDRIFRASQTNSKIRKIGELSDDGLKSFVFSIRDIAKAKLLSKDREDVDSETVNKIIKNDLRNKYPHATTAEVLMALDCGLDGQFLTDSEGWIKFSPSNLVIWIRKWLEEVKQPVMQKVSNEAQRVGIKKEPLLLEVDLKARLNDHFNILYTALQKVSAGQEFYDGGNIVFSLMKIADEDFVEFNEEITDEGKRLNVKMKLDLVVEQGRQASYLEDIRQGILNHLNNPS